MHPLLENLSVFTWMDILESNEKCISLLEDLKLIPRKADIAPICKKCSSVMCAATHKRYIIGWRWMCKKRKNRRNRCHAQVNPLDGTFFEGIHIPLRDVIALMFGFILKFGVNEMKEHMNSWRSRRNERKISGQTVVDFYSRFKHLILDSFKIRGEFSEYLKDTSCRNLLFKYEKFFDKEPSFGNRIFHFLMDVKYLSCSRNKTIFDFNASTALTPATTVSCHKRSPVSSGNGSTYVESSIKIEIMEEENENTLNSLSPSRSCSFADPSFYCDKILNSSTSTEKHVPGRTVRYCEDVDSTASIKTKMPHSIKTEVMDEDRENIPNNIFDSGTSLIAPPPSLCDTLNSSDSFNASVYSGIVPYKTTDAINVISPDNISSLFSSAANHTDSSKNITRGREKLKNALKRKRSVSMRAVDSSNTSPLNQYSNMSSTGCCITSHNSKTIDKRRNIPENSLSSSTITSCAGKNPDSSTSVRNDSTYLKSNTPLKIIDRESKMSSKNLSASGNDCLSDCSYLYNISNSPINTPVSSNTYMCYTGDVNLENKMLSSSTYSNVVPAIRIKSFSAPAAIRSASLNTKNIKKENLANNLSVLTNDFISSSTACSNKNASLISSTANFNTKNISENPQNKLPTSTHAFISSSTNSLNENVNLSVSTHGTFLHAEKNNVMRKGEKHKIFGLTSSLISSNTDALNKYLNSSAFSTPVIKIIKPPSKESTLTCSYITRSNTTTTTTLSNIAIPLYAVSSHEVLDLSAGNNTSFDTKTKSVNIGTFDAKNPKVISPLNNTSVSSNPISLNQYFDFSASSNSSTTDSITSLSDDIFEEENKTSVSTEFDIYDDNVPRKRNFKLNPSTYSSSKYSTPAFNAEGVNVENKKTSTGMPFASVNIPAAANIASVHENIKLSPYSCTSTDFSNSLAKVENTKKLYAKAPNRTPSLTSVPLAVCPISSGGNFNLFHCTNDPTSAHTSYINNKNIGSDAPSDISNLSATSSKIVPASTDTALLSNKNFDVEHSVTPINKHKPLLSLSSSVSTSQDTYCLIEENFCMADRNTSADSYNSSASLPKNVPTSVNVTPPNAENFDVGHVATSADIHNTPSDIFNSIFAAINGNFDLSPSTCASVAAGIASAVVEELNMENIGTSGDTYTSAPNVVNITSADKNSN